MKTNITTTTTKKHVVELSRKDLLDMLRQRAKVVVSDNAEVYVRVPGGGDWSNTNLDIDQDSPVVITWSETSH